MIRLRRILIIKIVHYHIVACIVITSEHQQGRRYECREDGCEKSYSSKDKLNVHYQVVHEGKTGDVTCRYCHKVFSRKANRIEHEQSMHRGIKTHVCAQCGEAFRSKFVLSGHVRKQHGERLECARCGKKYVWKRNLQEHMLTCKTINGERVYRCDNCDATYKAVRNLSRHQNIKHKTHSEVLCTVCGKRYNYNSSLKRHMARSH